VPSTFSCGRCDLSALSQSKLALALFTGKKTGSSVSTARLIEKF
jgi:hypothetical protein